MLLTPDAIKRERHSACESTLSGIPSTGASRGAILKHETQLERHEIDPDACDQQRKMIPERGHKTAVEPELAGKVVA